MKYIKVFLIIAGAVISVAGLSIAIALQSVAEWMKEMLKSGGR